MRDAYGEGREDNRIAFMNARDDVGKEAEPPRINQMGGQNRTLTMIMEALKANPAQSEVLRQMGMACLGPCNPFWASAWAYRRRHHSGPF